MYVPVASIDTPVAGHHNQYSVIMAECHMGAACLDNQSATLTPGRHMGTAGRHMGAVGLLIYAATPGTGQNNVAAVNGRWMNGP